MWTRCHGRQRAEDARLDLARTCFSSAADLGRHVDRLLAVTARTRRSASRARAAPSRVPRSVHACVLARDPGRDVVAAGASASALSSRRSTTASISPCSSRNSAVWKLSGSFCRMVCSITRGPAKPISAPRLGDDHVGQHRERLAVTPPVVGSVSTRCRAAAPRPAARAPPVVLAICIRASMPSCMRAPPDAVNTMHGSLRSRAPSSSSASVRRRPSPSCRRGN